MRLATILAALFYPLASVAALTANEVAELARAGVGDAVIIAQLEADGTRAHLSADTILRLQSEGVSDEVIVAMIRSGRRPAATEAPPSLAEQRRVLDRQQAAARASSTFVVTTTPLYNPYAHYDPYASYCPTPQPVPFQYIVGHDKPMFVNSSPGVYGAPPLCAPRIQPCRPNSGITIIVRSRADE